MTLGLGRTRSVALTGLAGTLVDVEAHIGQGLPCFTVGGLPDTACGQAPDRVRAAAANSGAPVPPHRVTVNLSPASIPKRGSGFDLGIAVAVLAAAGVVPREAVEDVVHLGELALDGRLRGVRGVLPAVLEAARRGVRHVVVPTENVTEAQLVDAVTVHGAETLAEVVHWYRRVAEGVPVPVAERRPPPAGDRGGGVDLADVVGQPEARAAIELAATGAHHLLMTGPPGVGKTMLAERLVTVLPPLSREHALEVHAVRSLVAPVGEVTALDPTPALRRPPPQHVRRRPRRGRLRHGAPRLGVPGPPGRALPRRGPRVPVLGPPGPPSAAGVRGGRHRPGPSGRALPRALPPGARREPLPVRPVLRQGRRLHLRAA